MLFENKLMSKPDKVKKDSKDKEEKEEEELLFTKLSPIFLVHNVRFDDYFPSLSHMNKVDKLVGASALSFTLLYMNRSRLKVYIPVLFTFTTGFFIYNWNSISSIYNELNNELRKNKK